MAYSSRQNIYDLSPSKIDHIRHNRIIIHSFQDYNFPISSRGTRNPDPVLEGDYDHHVYALNLEPFALVQ